MEILKIKNNRDLLEREVKLVGTVIGNFATNTGYWLKIVDAKGYSIFVFSPQYQFNNNDRIVAKGIVKRSDLYGIYVQGSRVLRRQLAPDQQQMMNEQYRQQMMIAQRNQAAEAVAAAAAQKKVSGLSQINPKLLIIGAVLFSLIAGVILYPMIGSL